MKCPKRMFDPHQVFNLPDDDAWREGEFPTCSYCGSLHPDTFMYLLGIGIELIPTDKNYKAYLKIGPHGQTKFYFEHLSVEQQKDLVVMLNSSKIKVDVPGYFYVLPYFLSSGEEETLSK